MSGGSYFDDDRSDRHASWQQEYDDWVDSASKRKNLKAEFPEGSTIDFNDFLTGGCSRKLVTGKLASRISKWDEQKPVDPKAESLPDEPSNSATIPAEPATSSSQPEGRPAKVYRLLHVFSGPGGRSDGLAAYIREAGWECDEFDVVNGEHQDLLDDVIWDALLAKIKDGHYDFIVAGPPCESFSHARETRPGPRPLRSVKFPYGFKNLKGFEAEQVRKGNLFAVRVAEACDIISERHLGGFLIENPTPWEDFASIWVLPEYIALAGKTDVHVTDFDQCEYGAFSTKPIRFMYKGVSSKIFVHRCSHFKQWFTDDRGVDYWSAHPRQVGRKKQGKWATKALAIWPGKLNKAIALSIKEARVAQTIAVLQRKFDEARTGTNAQSWAPVESTT